MRFRPFLTAVAAAFALSACSPKYEEAPAMSTYFAQLVPNAKADQVRSVSVCLLSDGDEEADWYASVMFSDEVLYHYRLQITEKDVLLEKPLQLEYFTSKQMREDESSSGRARIGCFTYEAEYEFDVRNQTRGYVLESTSIHTPFDDKVKLRLQRVALAVAAASDAHKKFVPVQATWGITP